MCFCPLTGLSLFLPVPSSFPCSFLISSVQMFMNHPWDYEGVSQKSKGAGSGLGGLGVPLFTAGNIQVPRRMDCTWSGAKSTETHHGQPRPCISVQSSCQMDNSLPIDAFTSCTAMETQPMQYLKLYTQMQQRQV